MMSLLLLLALSAAPALAQFELSMESASSSVSARAGEEATIECASFFEDASACRFFRCYFC